MEHLKVVIIGLDSMPPSLAFDIHRNRMPGLARLMGAGNWGPLRSTDPPITVPAWVSMTTGLDPGDLGLYGFRKKISDSYAMELVSPGDVTAPRLWDLIASQKKKSVVVSVPLTYPPCTNPLVSMTSCFLTPGPKSNWASTPAMAQDLERRFGRYIVDVDDFRTDDKSRILDDCRRMTKQHFAIFRHLLKTEQPSFGMIVDLGPDRLHHAMLSSCMPDHPKHSHSNPLNLDCAQYYSTLDDEITSVLDLLDEDTVVMVVSDHGVKPLLGSVCINEWLLQEGYLSLDEYPTRVTPLSRCRVNWEKTRAYGEGGYHARVFLNVKGREPRGIVPFDSIEKERRHLAEQLKHMNGPTGAPLKNRVLSPEDLYPAPTGSPPDLTVYFDDLSMRSAGTIGHQSNFIETNDTGPDEANHDYNGIWVMAKGRQKSTRSNKTASICDIFQTAISAMEIERPLRTRGKSLL